jgi:hypothetical protein
VSEREQVRRTNESVVGLEQAQAQRETQTNKFVEFEQRVNKSLERVPNASDTVVPIMAKLNELAASVEQRSASSAAAPIDLPVRCRCLVVGVVGCRVSS